MRFRGYIPDVQLKSEKDNRTDKNMKYAIVSDIHGNLEAFRAVLEKCGQLGVNQYICLGDTVGYGADPSACLQLLRSLNPLAVVKGNHDEFASNDDEVMEGFNPHARAAVLWTKSQLSADEREYLARLPLRVSPRGTKLTVVHATLDSPDSWGYIFDSHHAADNFAYQYTLLCFCGHSHVPLAFCKKPVLMHSGKPIEEITDWAMHGETDFTRETYSEIFIQNGFKYLVNVGSVGQPRNRDPRASFAVYDDEKMVITRYTIPYDIATAQAKIRAAGLPERLASRLEVGG